MATPEISVIFKSYPLLETSLGLLGCKELDGVVRDSNFPLTYAGQQASPQGGPEVPGCCPTARGVVGDGISRDLTMPVTNGWPKGYGALDCWQAHTHLIFRMCQVGKKKFTLL